MDIARRAYSCFQDILARLQEEFPAGITGFLVVSATSMFLWQRGKRYLLLRKTKERIQKRKVKAMENISTMRQRLATYKEDVDLSIVDLSFPELNAKLKKGELSCHQALLAYQTKALEVHDRLNCVTGFILNAEERARELDSLKPEERGPLHGIPMSLKEVVGVKGEDSTAGYSYFIDKIYSENSVIVKTLLKQGAVPFVFTNIPQGQLSFSCSNPIFGETCNPVKPDRVCGGSSGGEAALLGGHGSILGVGCDAAGSNRVPAQFCGICGLKPTGERVSLYGNMPFGDGTLLLKDVYGPLARDVSALTAYMKVTLDPVMFDLDPLMTPLAWRDELHTSRKPMKIGYYVHDGGLMPVPAVERAVLLAKKVLEQMGHEVVPFSPPDVVSAVVDFEISVLMSDDGKSLAPMLKDEVIDPCLERSLIVENIPYPVRWVLSKLLYFLHPVERCLLTARSHGSIYNWWNKTEEREAYRRKFTSLMKTQKLDAILCPAYPIPAFPIGNAGHSMAGITYTAIYNVLDFPTGVIPVTHVTAEDVKAMESYPKKYKTDKYVHTICEGSEGLPIGVQCGSFPYQEEVVLRMMKGLETGLDKASC